MQRNELTPPQGLNLYFLCKGTLVAFDNGVKLIIMYRWIVSLKYGMAPLKQGNSDSYHIWRSGSHLLRLLHTDKTEQKAPDAEILCGRDCGLWVLKGPSVSSNEEVAVIFLHELRSL